MLSLRYWQCSSWEANLADLPGLTLLLAENPGANPIPPTPGAKSLGEEEEHSLTSSAPKALAGGLKCPPEGVAPAHSSALSQPGAAELQQPLPLSEAH